MIRKAAKPQVFFLLSILGGLCVAIIAFRFLPLLEWITALQLWMQGRGALGALVFLLVYAACNILLLPAGMLGVGSGLLFGLWWGFLIILMGNVLGAAGAFLISRFFIRRWIEDKMAHSARWSVLDSAIARDGGKIIVLSQLHPLFPTSLLNYFYGGTKIRFWPCMLWVAVGQAPGLFLYVYLGTLSQYGLNIIRGTSAPSTWEYVLWIGGLLVGLVVTGMLGRLALRMLRQFRAAS